MRGRSFFALALCAMLTFFAAGNAGAASITVSAAASLTNAFAEVKDAFMKRHPDVVVVTNFAASNPLLRQIEEGAPVDVFASADQDTMNTAAGKNLIDEGTRVDFALNGLVLIVPADSGPALAGPEDLKKETVKKIAVGNPASVPAGRYAKDSLTSSGLWDVLQPKFIMGENVRQTLDYVSRGEVEAGIVYMTDAKQAGDKVRVVTVLGGHSPVLYPIAVIKSAASPKEAKAFIDFVLSDEGSALLSKYGFAKPERSSIVIVSCTE
jgi:molybdate transport system substrate-binding protein